MVVGEVVRLMNCKKNYRAYLSDLDRQWDCIFWFFRENAILEEFLEERKVNIKKRVRPVNYLKENPKEVVLAAQDEFLNISRGG